MAVEKKRKVESLQSESGANEIGNDVNKKAKLNPVHQVSESHDSEHMNIVGEEPVVHGKSRKRHRKKKLYDDLCQQMEFYFGDANLSKSKFMNEEMLKIEGGWIDLNVFLRFNKLAEMMKNYFGKLDIEDLWTALSYRLNREQKADGNGKSTLLEIRSEDGTKQIRRNKPINVKSSEDVEKCTVYIENLPPFVTNDSLKKMFNDKYGAVDYVSLPRYKHNRAVKGFAFIEFSNTSGAEATIKAFEEDKDSAETSENKQANENQRIKPEITDPADLQSVQSYQKEQAIELESNIPSDSQDKPDSECNIKNEKCAVVKVEECSSKSPEEVENPDKNVENLDGGCDETNEGKTSKKRRKRNKNKNIPINLPHHQSTYINAPEGSINPFPPMDVGSSDDYVLSVLRIMTKEEWRKMRNKYLNLQKLNMSSAKNKIRQMKALPRDKYKETTQVKTESNFTPASNENESTTTAGSSNKSTIEYVPGTIVRFITDEPIIDQGKQVKSRIRAAVMEPVKYVDATNGNTKVFVRCSNQKQAEVIAAAKNLLGASSGEILTGSDETEYWEKIQSDRQDKISGKIKVKPAIKKERGKDRLVKKFENSVRNTHKFFDDAE